MVNKLNSFKRRYKSIKSALVYYFYNSFLTNFPNYKIRTFYLRNLLGIHIGEGTAIHMGCYFSGRNISIGNYTVIARKCFFDGRTPEGFITIKDNVSLGLETAILTVSHQSDSPVFEGFSKPVTIEDFVWTGARANILPGVTMGKGSVLGAASTATKSVSEFTIVAGTPAKEVGKRSPYLNYQLHYFPYFDTDVS